MAGLYLIGLDGSAFADAAVELGLRWAKRTGAKLVGLAVVDEPAITGPQPVGIYGDYFKHERDESLLAGARVRADDFLRRFVARCADAGVPHEGRRVEGDPIVSLAHAACDHDLTLLGRQTFFRYQTQEGCDETLPGVVRECGRPVVAVPESLPQGQSAVVAYDASPPSVRALEAFRASGLAAGIRVRVVSVDEDRAVAQRRAEEAALFLRHDGIDAEAAPTAGDGQSALILGAVREFGAGLLVTGAYGRSHIRELLFGSTTARVLAACPVPVFMRH
jgi:nucleotide-binding universal stress UspA family protein